MTSDERKNLRRHLGALLTAFGLLFTTGCPAQPGKPAGTRARAQGASSSKVTGSGTGAASRGKAGTQRQQGSWDDCYSEGADGSIYDDCAGEYVGHLDEVETWAPGDEAWGPGTDGPYDDAGVTWIDGDDSGGPDRGGAAGVLGAASGIEAPTGGIIDEDASID